MTQTASLAAVALMGPAKARATVRRSRPMTHVLGPGLHRTHYPRAAILTTIRMYYNLALYDIILWHFGTFFGATDIVFNFYPLLQ